MLHRDPYVSVLLGLDRHILGHLRKCAVDLSIHCEQSLTQFMVDFRIT